MAIISKIRHWAKQQRTVSELNTLTKQQLRDIGIDRDVAGFVREHRFK